MKELTNPIIKQAVESRFSKFLGDFVESKIINAKAKKDFLSTLSKVVVAQHSSFSKIRTIALGNTPIGIEEIYVPLTLKSADKKEICVDGSQDAFAHGNHLLIEDKAGMGKSTVSRKIYIDTLRNTDAIPIFIELRKLKSEDIKSEILNIFGLKKDVSFDLIDSKNIVFIFDGADEISNEKKIETILELSKFCQERQKNKIIISSRKEQFVSEFTSFKWFSIEKLTDHQAYELLKKHDNGGEVSTSIIKNLTKDRSGAITEYLSTPLFVSLLFLSYKHKPILPRKRDGFYSQVFDALFEAHDLSKQMEFCRKKNPNLMHQILEQFFEGLGYGAYKKTA